MSFPSQMMDQLQEAVRVIQSRLGTIPKTAVVLGSGLNGVVARFQADAELKFADVPHVAAASVLGHQGKLLKVQVESTPTLFVQGRLHYYEGHSPSAVVFPFRALALAGVENFVLTNAAGSLHADLQPANFLLIRDHINFMGMNPLIGKNLEELGPRFPDLTQLYNPQLRALFLSAAQQLGMPLREGVYVGVAGPSFETPAEIQFFLRGGADVVGMSTIPEAIALHHMGKKVVGLSCVSNLAAGIASGPANHEEVLETGKQVETKFEALLRAVLPRIPS